MVVYETPDAGSGHGTLPRRVPVWATGTASAQGPHVHLPVGPRMSPCRSAGCGIDGVDQRRARIHRGRILLSRNLSPCEGRKCRHSKGLVELRTSVLRLLAIGCAGPKICEPTRNRSERPEVERCLRSRRKQLRAAAGICVSPFDAMAAIRSTTAGKRQGDVSTSL
jgi:hypothetical protein